MKNPDRSIIEVFSQVNAIVDAGGTPGRHLAGRTLNPGMRRSDLRDQAPAVIVEPPPDVYRPAARNDHYPHTGPLYRGPIYPGNGYPSSPGQDRPGLSPFGRLAKEQPLGKSTILPYNNTINAIQAAPTQILQLEGDNLDAAQLCVTLCPPRVIPLAFADWPIDPQNATNEQDNAEVSTDDFPGTASPIVWPPLEAVIEWGVGGTGARAVVDFTNGVTLNLIASYLRVYAVVSQSEASGGISGTSALYYLAAFVGPGFGKNTGARRTVYVGTVDVNDESAVFDVPKFARRAYVVGCDNSAVPNVFAGTLRFWQSSDGQAGGNSSGSFFQSSNQPTAFDIPNGSQYFSVYSIAPVNMRVAVIFELSL